MTDSTQPEVAFVQGRLMPATSSSSSEVALTVVFRDGSERELAAWSEVLEPFNVLLLSRSPDGGRIAAAAGGSVRTFQICDGALLATAPISGSVPQSLIFGWPDEGGAVVHTLYGFDEQGRTRATGKPLTAFPIGDGWTMSVNGGIDDDGGFSGGFTGSSMGLMWEIGTPVETQVHHAAMARIEAIDAAAAAKAARGAFRVELRRADHTVELVETVGREEQECLLWPPVVGPSGVLLRRDGSTVEINERPSPTDPGVGSSSGPLSPWFVSVDGAAQTMPLDLSVSPVCALADGRFLLPGASPTWRDGGDEPIHTISIDGTVEPWTPGGAGVKCSTVAAALAPDLLPDVLPDDPRAPAWGAHEDEGLWVQAARLSGDGSAVRLLLAEVVWPVDDDEPEASPWLVAEVELETGAMHLVARGSRAEGEHLVIAV